MNDEELELRGRRLRGQAGAECLDQWRAFREQSGFELSLVDAEVGPGRQSMTIAGAGDQNLTIHLGETRPFTYALSKSGVVPGAAAARMMGIDSEEMVRVSAAARDGLESAARIVRAGEFEVEADAILDRVDPALDELINGIQLDVTVSDSSGRTVATISDVDEESGAKFTAWQRANGSLEYRTRDGNEALSEQDVAGSLAVSSEVALGTMCALEEGFRDAERDRNVMRGRSETTQRPTGRSVQERNTVRMERQVPAGIRSEELAVGRGLAQARVGRGL